jgi:hypothetical protein
MNKKYYLSVVLAIIFSVLISAFSPIPQSEKPTIYTDDYESYLTTAQLNAAYTVWEDGAMVRISIEKGYINSGSQALQVDIQGANPNTHATSGSIYHLISSTENNWKNGVGTRFWIYNQSKHPLSLSLNFKEKYNEFWAVANVGEFYLITEDGNFLQKEIEYGNLIIPAFYHGYVFVPFECFAVPDWNTAIGDEEMDLSDIDSISLAMNVTVAEVQRFSIDDLSVLTSNNALPPIISGNKYIDIPPSGQHQEQFRVALPASVTHDNVTQQWKIINQEDTLASIDENGWLTVPSDTTPAVITILHQYILDDQKVNTLFEVRLIDPNAEIEPTQESIVSEEVQAIQEENADYQQFSENFDLWASKNRTWFVVIAISLIMILIAAFSIIQGRLK